MKPNTLREKTKAELTQLKADVDAELARRSGGVHPHPIRWGDQEFHGMPSWGALLVVRRNTGEEDVDWYPTRQKAEAALARLTLDSVEVARVQAIVKPETASFTAEHVGCYSDGAFGHDHARARLAELISSVRPQETELIQSLRGPMPDDDFDTDDAVCILNQHCAPGVGFDFVDGNLMLIVDDESEIE